MKANILNDMTEMKTKNIINKTRGLVSASLLALLPFMSSCTLESENYTEISPENFPKTENDLKLLVNQLYWNFSAGGWDGSCINAADKTGYQIMSDMTTDALWCAWGWEWDDTYYQQWGPTLTGILPKTIEGHYNHYNFLSTARNTIRRIQDSDVAASAKKLYAAEVHALRGWMALYLYDFFGPVPVASDAELDDPEKFVYLPRLTEEEYDAMMESDLRAAIAGLPEKASATGRMTKGAAMMLLLKYYMIRGAEGAEGMYQKAETLARELLAMEGSVYELVPNYMSIFTVKGEVNKETILQVPCTSTMEWLANHLTAECIPGDMEWTADSKGWGGYLMPWDYYYSFEEGDARLDGLVTEYTNMYGQLITPETDGSQLEKGAIIVKYGKDPDTIEGNSGVDVVIYRFSDVLLTVAELAVRNGGAVTQEAIDLVNRVRNRVNLPNLSEDATGSVDAFMEALLQERGHEFYMEGLRRQDLIRFGKFVDYANFRIAKANNPQLATVPQGRNRFYIPQWYIDESHGAIKASDQNIGY